MSLLVLLCIIYGDNKRETRFFTCSYLYPSSFGREIVVRVLTEQKMNPYILSEERITLELQLFVVIQSFFFLFFNPRKSFHT